MEVLECLEKELKDLLIETLVLEDITPEEIDSTEPLFLDGLGLDSIDALEIAMVLEQHYDVIIGENDEENRTHFASIRSLANFVAENRRQQ